MIRSKKTVIDGIEFDSKTEAEYYEYLRERMKKGEIFGLRIHPVFALQLACERHGKKYRGIDYIADFSYFEHGRNGAVVVDVKGFAMEDAKLKRKMFVNKYPSYKLLWISKSKKYSDTGWIDYDELQKLRRKVRKEKRR